MASTSYGNITLRPEVRWFAEQMELQLRANDHKPGWDQDSDLSLFRRVDEEVQELSTALFQPPNSDNQADDEAVVKEAADVSNFCMMLASNRYRNLQHSESEP